MRTIVAKNADSQAALLKMKRSYPKSYSLTEVKSADVNSEKSEA